jgi:very-short-patch-repair endonuclease
MLPRSVRPGRARHLRSNLTDAELRLWQRIRKKQLYGYRFRRQVPLGPYIVDFVCIERSLIVEVDGGQHDWRMERDFWRTAWLEAHGWRVVRFWNNEVSENIAGVLERLVIELQSGGDIPHPDPPPQAEEGIAEVAYGGTQP